MIKDNTKETKLLTIPVIRSNKNTDIYSIGMILWFLFHQKDPFGNNLSKQEISLQLKKNPTSPLPINTNCPPLLKPKTNIKNNNSPDH